MAKITAEQIMATLQTTIEESIDVLESDQDQPNGIDDLKSALAQRANLHRQKHFHALRDGDDPHELGYLSIATIYDRLAFLTVGIQTGQFRPIPSAEVDEE